MPFTHISLIKNGAVSTLISTPSVQDFHFPSVQQQLPQPFDKNGNPFGTAYYDPNAPGSSLLNFDFQKQIIDPLNAEISGAIQLHQVDIAVAVIGVLLIVVAVAAIAKPI